MRALAFAEREKTAEWKMNYDPVATEKRIATEGIPPAFKDTYDELESWRKIMDKRCNIKNPEPEFGPEVMEEDEAFWATRPHSLKDARSALRPSRTDE